MLNTLWFSGGTRSVQQEQWILRVNWYGREIWSVFLQLIVPPKITASQEWDMRVSGSLEHKHVAHMGTFLQCVVHDLFRLDGLSASLGLIGGDDDSGVGIDDSVPQRRGRETSKHHGMERTNSNDSQESHNGFWDHGQINRYGVAFLDSEIGKSSCQLADILEQFTIGDGSAFVDLVSLVNDGGFFWVFHRPSVHSIVRSVQLTIDEPRWNISIFKVVFRINGKSRVVKRSVPVQEQFRSISKKRGRVFDRLFVELFILVQRGKIRFGSGPLEKSFWRIEHFLVVQVICTFRHVLGKWLLLIESWSNDWPLLKYSAGVRHPHKPFARNVEFPLPRIWSREGSEMR